jgi:carbonic anhydrase
MRGQSIKILSLLLCLIFSQGLLACSKKEAKADEHADPKAETHADAGHAAADTKGHGDDHAKSDDHGAKTNSHGWTYEGEMGPDHWGSLSKENVACGIGKRQSPIDIAPMPKKDFVKIKLDYTPSPATIQNNGHTVQIALANGGGVVVDGVRYHLKQFHFHTPSEHGLKGKRSILETHFVHANDKGELLVMGVLADLGVADPVLASLITYMPTDEGKPLPIADLLVNPKDLMPSSQDFIVYAGSLTTPPCSEGVTWMVYEQTLSLSTEQADVLAQLMGPNARPIQARQDRDILSLAAH